VDEYINSLISEEDAKVLVQSAVNVIHDDDDNKKDDKEAEIVYQKITQTILVKQDMIHVLKFINFLEKEKQSTTITKKHMKELLATVQDQSLSPI
jgi:hypothetical protein